MPETSPLNQSGRTTPDTSHLNITSGNESTLTTPDTPLCSSYAPLIESPDPPRPEERKQKPYHPYENVGPLVKTSPVLETSFDVVETPGNRDSVGSVKYEMISTESSCDSLIDFKKTDESKSLIGLVQKVSEEEEVPEPEENSEVSEVGQLVLMGTKMEVSDGKLHNEELADEQEIESCERVAKELMVVEVKECGSYQSSEENLSGVASMFVEMDKCESCLDCGDFSTDSTSHDRSMEMNLANLESDVRNGHSNLLIYEERNDVSFGDCLLNIEEDASQKETQNQTELDRIGDFAASLLPSNWMSSFCESQSNSEDSPFDKSHAMPDSSDCDPKVSSDFENFDWFSDKNPSDKVLATEPDLRDSTVETELSENLSDPGPGNTAAIESSYWAESAEKDQSEACMAREQHLDDGTFNLVDKKVDQSQTKPESLDEADWPVDFDANRLEFCDGSETAKTNQSLPSSDAPIGCSEGSDWAVDFEVNQSETCLARFGDSSIDNDITDDIPTDQSLPGVDLRVGDTSASSEASDWTTVIHKDLSEGVLDTESLSEDTSISSGDSEKATEAIQEAEKENVPLEKPEKIEGSPRKNIRVARQAEHLNQRPKEMKKPPRKINLDMRKSLEEADRTRRIDAYRIEPSVTRRKSSPNSETLAISDLPLLDRSPTLRSGRRGSSEDKKTSDGVASRQTGGTCENSPSPVHRMTDRCPPARGERKDSWEDMDSQVCHRLLSGDKVSTK